MQSQFTASCLHRELGDYLEMLRYATVDGKGKIFTIKEVCHSAGMSARTYDNVKKEPAQTLGSIIASSVSTSMPLWMTKSASCS